MEDIIKDSLSELDKEEKSFVPSIEEFFETGDALEIKENIQSDKVPQIKKRRRQSKRSGLVFDPVIEIPADEMSQRIKDRSSILRSHRDSNLAWVRYTAPSCSNFLI
jgi:hypothetical protein